MADDHVTDGDSERHVAELFRQTVPEIAAGTVTIRAVARKVGVRTKIAVTSADASLDAVGACVGARGERVMTVKNALNGEPIDIVPWVDAPERRIRFSLAPLPVTQLELDAVRQRARVWAPETDLAKFNQDQRDLASRLSGWELQLEASPPAA